VSRPWLERARNPVATRDLVELVIIDLDQRTDLDERPLPAVPADVARLGENGEATHGPIRILCSIR